MQIELVQAATQDGVRLDGALAIPPPDKPAQFPLDAALLIHGTGGNFYGSTLLNSLAGRFADWGLATLRANTRGHDCISTSGGPGGRRVLGSSYEIVDDCRFDVRCWLEFLSDRGFRRILLLGHSLGAVKVLYALSQDQHPAVARLAAVSPPRLSHARFRQGRGGDEFLADNATALAHLEAGRPDALMDIRFPLPYVVSAAGYLDKYGAEEKYNILKFIERLTCPTLVTFGDLELRGSSAFEGLADDLMGISSSQPSLFVTVIAGGDHQYTGAQLDLAEWIGAWLRKL